MLATKKSENFVNSLLGKMAGKEVSLKTRKTPKIKTVRQAEDNAVKPSNKIPEELEIINPDKASYIDEETIKTKRRYKRKEKLSMWLKTDFALYIKDLYWQRYQEDWGFSPQAVANAIAKVMDNIRDNLGFVTNLVVRDYIDFFFQEHIDKAIKECEQFFMSRLYSKDIIRIFAETYDHNAAVVREQNKNKLIQKQEAIVNITNDDLEQSYMLGEESLICEYGLVLAVNWMWAKKKIEKKEIVLKVCQVCSKLNAAGKFDVIRRATEKYKYPSWFKFQKPNELLLKVDDSLKVNVEFTTNDSVSKMFDFIKGE